MKIYMWDYEAPVSDSYHDGGAVVILTGRDPQEVWSEYRTVEGGNRWLEELPEPDRVIEVDGVQDEEVYIYSDAGCC